MNKYREEYINRINRVVDYIEKHIDSELNLDLLADVAMFSAYHFHRIFSAFTGETLNSYIKRQRIERAANMLLKSPDITITEVALSCGYSSSSVFCRNFKERFGISANEYRETNDWINSKKHQLDSKIGKWLSSEADYFCNVEILKLKGIIMENIEVKNMPALNLVYTRHIGQFHLIGQAYGRLMQWAGARGLLNNPNLKTVTVYHDNPTITDIDKLRQSACITVEGDVKTEGEYGKMTVPAGKYIVGRFEIGVDGFEGAWNAVCHKLSESGYEPSDGLPYELYHNNHEEHPERKFILDICIPVRIMN